MPPKKTLKSVIPKSKSATKPATKPLPTKDATKKNASEIDDIFSTGVIASTSSSQQPKKVISVEASKEVKKNGSKKHSEESTVKTSVNPTSIKTSKKGKGPSHLMTVDVKDDLSDDSEEEEEDVNEEDLFFDEEEQNESEEAAIAKLMAKKNSTESSKTASSSATTTPTATTKAATTKPRSGAKVVEAVVFNERPAAAAAAAAAAKIQKFKRARNDGPDSDDELEKKGKRRTDDGLRLFDIHDLNIGKGGDTEKCPFDCECCF
ncbi:hypothetical protein BGZ46_002703 [Entomortierella lignicola]|nr:hypothetical protein BGZ46_002703 [Entomortierella lignicola]